MKSPNKKYAPRRRKKQSPFAFRHFTGVIGGLCIVSTSVIILRNLIGGLATEEFDGWLLVLIIIGVIGVLHGVWILHACFYDRSPNDFD